MEMVTKGKGSEPFSAILVGKQTHCGIHHTLQAFVHRHRRLHHRHIGNKCDVDAQKVSDRESREVTPQEGAALAHKMSLGVGCAVPFIETSAKFNTNVTSAFAGNTHARPVHHPLVD
jgi:hypothetical protein